MYMTNGVTPGMNFPVCVIITGRYMQSFINLSAGVRKVSFSKDTFREIARFVPKVVIKYKQSAA